ncbi:M23 family metallopeptidase [Streptomyces candidus]|uniref:Murein DD-endopeptidase MepM/ murein hydrolase activator NlpD n=1 Tax=Streptomyces candidus TaxID=67283 RepID=A0A7X0HCJ1_9ACTN|nr:M23 family metallopeptidase [Streptomyces candidus]MBB6434996.1 murein DD-endopeptidase MepM/ murein hydrolase activator NlpD [Streptomyces candidus]GHH41084.1 peptidase [Streptomyces candidus]
MNDQQPHAGYDTYPTGTFENGTYENDPLFGGPSGTSTPTGTYDTSPWDTGSHENTAYGAYAAHSQQAHTLGQGPDQGQSQGYDTSGSWAGPGDHGHTADIPAQAGPLSYGYDSGDAPTTGQWDAQVWNQADQIHQAQQSPFESGQFDATQFAYTADSSVGHQWQPYDPSPETATFEAGTFGTGTFETGDAGHFEPGGLGTGTYEADSFDAGSVSTSGVDTGVFDASDWDPAADSEPADTAAADGDYSTAEFPAVLEVPDDADGPGPVPEPVAAGPRAARRAPAGRGRRRPPAKRSAFIKVAVPSACVMGVAGIAAASVSGVAGAEETKPKPVALTTADPATVKAVAVNRKLDTQLAGLSADARDFGDRASRTQERIDLKVRQDAERKRKAEEAARKEAARPKFVLPVEQHGLSAYYGQAGVNWAAVHTGIDFPVGYGTPVMAATDGEVSYQYNSAYGNMMKVVSPSGTETWYCHLSTTKIRSGPVKAGDVIGYAGDSGNSTGAHLHFEVRPAGGSAVDPLAWLRSKGLDPT